jgi:hypothetical protein
MVDVVVWALAPEDKRWNIKRVRKGTISEEQDFLNLTSLTSPLRL